MVKVHKETSNPGDSPAMRTNNIIRKLDITWLKNELNNKIMMQSAINIK